MYGWAIVHNRMGVVYQCIVDMKAKAMIFQNSWDLC